MKHLPDKDIDYFKYDKYTQGPDRSSMFPKNKCPQNITILFPIHPQRPQLGYNLFHHPIEHEQ